MIRIKETVAIKLGDMIKKTKKLFNKYYDASDVLSLIDSSDETRGAMEIGKVILKNSAEIFGKLVDQMDEMNETIHQNNEMIEQLQENIEELRKELAEAH